MHYIYIYIYNIIEEGTTAFEEGVGEKLPGTDVDYLKINSADLFLSSSSGVDNQASKFYISLMITSLAGTGKKYILHADSVCISILYKINK